MRNQFVSFFLNTKIMLSQLLRVTVLSDYFSEISLAHLLTYGIHGFPIELVFLNFYNMHGNINSQEIHF